LIGPTKWTDMIALRGETTAWTRPRSNSRALLYAQTIAGAMTLKLDADNPADREKLRRAVLELVAGRKMRK
jgi:hypothetical protein